MQINVAVYPAEGQESHHFLFADDPSRTQKTSLSGIIRLRQDAVFAVGC
jgi:hypothetical protein